VGLGERPLLRFSPLTRCVFDGGDLGSTRRDKG
jgi:hypothetical protein